MLQGININERISFTYSKDSDPKTEIIIKPLSSFEMMKMTTAMQEGDMAAIILASVVEIKNPDITDSGDVATYVSALKLGILTELMDKITSINNMTDDEQKN